MIMVFSSLTHVILFLVTIETIGRTPQRFVLKEMQTKYMNVNVY